MLLTTDYKILTKTLANRLQEVLPILVHWDQTACVPGRTINDNVSLICDAIQYANESNTPLTLISIDQLKAFDRVSHEFLSKVLWKFGFGPAFQQWIKTIYNTASSSVKVNGWFTPFIHLECGLRQLCSIHASIYPDCRNPFKPYHLRTLYTWRTTRSKTLPISRWHFAPTAWWWLNK